ncbi:MAG: methylmalonyl-CoA mutase family protein [Hyphomicrobiaceae bacterium]
MAADGGSGEGNLAEQFEAPTHDQWMALVEKALKGGDFEKRLVAQTRDGVRINPLYTRSDAIEDIQDGVPGVAPFTRGVSGETTGLGWDILGLVVARSPKDANSAVLAELEGGANGVMLQVAGPGQPGVELKDAGSAAEVLSGVYLDYASINMRAGANAMTAAKAIVGGLGRLEADGEKVRGCLNVSPIESFGATGTAGQPLGDALKDVVDFANETRATYPGLKVVTADASVAHEAGASEATELAFLAASLVAYLRAFETEGVGADAALASIAFGIRADSDLFLTAAKLRAARHIIWRIGDAVGAGDGAKHIQITATTSERMMAKRDVWTNMLRTTAACAAAALGGANAIVVHPFTWPLGKPDEFAARIARNQQIVAQEESSLGRVVDPAGGSWYVEQLTEKLAKEAWKQFQEIETEGGLIASLQATALQKRIAATAQARAQDIAVGRQALTGVSTFPILGDDGVTITPHDEVSPVEGKELATPLTPHRVAEPFEDLRDQADKFEAKTGAKPQVFLASMGVVADHNVRTSWMKNFLAAGGIEALISEGYMSAADCGAAFKKSNAKLACLCSSDAGYATYGVATTKALKAAGAGAILFAGKPGELKSDLDGAGVSQYVSVGQDSVEVLKGLHRALGVS